MSKTVRRTDGGGGRGAALLISFLLFVFAFLPQGAVATHRRPVQRQRHDDLRGHQDGRVLARNDRRHPSGRQTNIAQLCRAGTYTRPPAPSFAREFTI